MITGALVLAGGCARRMGGQPKALLELDGISFLQRLALAFEPFEEKLLSTNDPGLSSGTPFQSVSDLFPHRGPLSGLHAALSMCKSDALVVAACDAPLFSSALAQWLAAERERLCIPAVGLRDRSGREHPLCGVYTKNCLPSLEAALSGNRLRVMELFDAVGGIFLPLGDTPFPDAVLTNVNTPEELAALICK